jgi:multiple sugar transport system permease protein
VSTVNEDESRAHKLYDELLLDEAATTAPAEEVPRPGAPVLPRLRLTTPGAKAPLTIKRKAAASLPPVSAAQLLPEILKQVDEARKAQAEQAAKARAEASARLKASGAAAAAVPASAEAPEPFKPLTQSRVAWRYALVFGKRIERVWKGRQRELAEDDGSADKAIYTVRGGETALRVPEFFWQKPSFAVWAFLLPALAAFLLFSWLPLLRGFVSAFQSISLSGDIRWIGTANFERAFNDPQVWATFGHALLFCGLSLALGFWLPVALALYANEIRKGQSLIKLVFFLPFLTPAVPAVVLWRWIFDQGYGLLNSLISLLPFVHDPHIPWLNRPFLAMLSVVIVFLWKNTGWNALIYMTALREVPEELYETAELDGAPLLTRIRQVSLPYLRSTMGFLLLMQVISTLQIFTEVYLLTSGGPMNSTEMIATYMYKKSFLYLDIGYAAALGVMLFAVLLSFTALRLRRLEEEA